MTETTIKVITNSDGTRRVLIVKVSDTRFNFCEEYWSDDPFERCWLSGRQQFATICSSAEEAEREARGRVAWLKES